MTPHTIEHIGDVAFNNHDSKGYMKDVLHVPTSSKECKYDSTFFEDKGQFRVHARRKGCMFIIDTTEVNTAIYAKELKAESDIELWLKRIGHVNLGILRSIQTKGAVHGLPQFTLKNPDNICEA